jgi:RimJ/RimL family protein N-acetyltransferase
MHCAAATSRRRLDSGDILTIRAATPKDAEAVARFLEELSPDARRLRYHSPVPRVRWWMVEAVAAADHDVREALLAFLDGRIVGLAEWGRDPERPGRAHVGIVVDDDLRQRGIAKALMRRLADDARRHGIADFIATVVPANRPALSLLERLAPVRHSRFDGGAVEVHIPLTASA